MILFGCVILAWANVGFGGNISVPICEVGLYTTRIHPIPLSNPIGGRSYHHREFFLTANMCSSLWWDDLMVPLKDGDPWCPIKIHWVVIMFFYFQDVIVDGHI